MGRFTDPDGSLRQHCSSVAFYNFALRLLEGVSLGRAAELCRLSVEAFLDYAGKHGAPMHYGPDELEEDRATLERLRL